MPNAYKMKRKKRPMNALSRSILKYQVARREPRAIQAKNASFAKSYNHPHAEQTENDRDHDVNRHTKEYNNEGVKVCRCVRRVRGKRCCVEK